jgi:hypothetical protein
MPDSLKEMGRELRMPHPTAEIEALLRSDRDTLRLPWPTEAVISLRDEIQLSGGFVLVEIYQPIPKAYLEGVLDAVRNRLLDFLLAIQELSPEALESDEALEITPRERIDQAFNITVFGGQPLIAAGRDVLQQVVQVTPGSLPDLLEALRGLGIGESDLKDWRARSTKTVSGQRDTLVIGSRRGCRR